MSTSAITPWRDRRHIGMRLHGHHRCVAAGQPDGHPAASSDGPMDGPPGAIRDWPAFTLVILDVTPHQHRRVRIVGPSWASRPQAPAYIERYDVAMPAGGEAELRAKLRAVVDARQAAWCLEAGHSPATSAGCPLHAAAG